MRFPTVVSATTSLLVLIGAILLAVMLRVPVLEGAVIDNDPEAPYHALWTAKVLQESAIGSHYLMPSVTLEPSAEKRIPWGRTVRNPQGAQIYTSFPSLSFLLVAAVLPTPIDLDSMTGLVLLNMGIGLIAAMLCGMLVREFLLAAREQMSEIGTEGAPRRPSLWESMPFFALPASLYLLTAESLSSHGGSFWAQSPAQVFFLVAALTAVRSLFSAEGRGEGLGAPVPRRIELPLMALSIFLYGATEWSGLVFGVGLAMLFRVHDHGYSRRCRLAIAATVAAGLVVVVPLVVSLGAIQTVAALITRASARGHTQSVSLMDLAVGYTNSFPVLALGALGAVLIIGFRLRWNRKPILVGLAVLALPLLENIVMLSHAVQFDFDRLKAGPLILTLIFLASSLVGRRFSIAMLAIVPLVVLINVNEYHRQQRAYADWVQIDAQNRQLVADARMSSVDGHCLVWASSGRVRGYLDLLAGADIYENMKREAFVDILRRRGCDGFYIDSRLPYADLSEILSIDRVGMTTDR